jgi:nucleolar protein TMA23
VGKKQHKTSDMWWMNAFDKSLKGLDTKDEGKVVQTLTNGGLDLVSKGGSEFVGSGGLYASFVRGESLSGTITPEDPEVQSPAKGQRIEERKETKEERRARKVARRAARARGLLNLEDAVPAPINEPPPAHGEEGDEVTEEVETKVQRRERRRQKKLMRQAENNSVKDAIKPAKKKKRRKE